MENKLIARRLIAGIFLIIATVPMFIESMRVINYSGTLYIPKSAEPLGAGGVFLSILSLAVGIFFCVTCKRRPVKWQEYTLAIIGVVFFVILGLLSHQDYYTDLTIWRWLFVILMCLGLPLKNGFKDMPFESKTRKEVTEKVEPTEPIKKEEFANSSTKELRDLKKLLDDGIITQEDFDKKKKQILKL